MNPVRQACRMIVICLLSVGGQVTDARAESVQDDRRTDSSSVPRDGLFPQQGIGLENSMLEQNRSSPVNDQERRLLTSVDVLEYRPRTSGNGSDNDYRWDLKGRYGGDENRLWFKSEGQQDTAFKAGYDIDFQLLYGRVVQKQYEIQVGGRMETQSFRGGNVARGLAAISLQGWMPYNYELETALFIDQNGAVSARLSCTKDVLLTQRFILQGRFQANLAIQRVEEFTTGSGLNNLEFGIRLRYELHRKLAPYIGLSFERSFGETATFVRQQGGDPSQIQFAVGVRMWF